MNRRRTPFIVLFCFFVLRHSTWAQDTTAPLPYIMDMVHNNPGEKPYDTKYNDPGYVRSQGYNGIVPRWFVSCAITYDNFKKNTLPKNSAERKWIEQEAAAIDRKLAECKKAGLGVYPFTDFIIFPAVIWKLYGDSIKNTKAGVGSVLGGKGEDRKPDISRPVTQSLLRAQITGIFDRFPQLDGIVLRFGETYLHDTPFHKGGSPIGNGRQGIEDHITFINILREEICVKRNKKLFYRTWDFGYNFHTNPEYYLAVTNAIEPHPNLVFSIKYQQGDFLRMTPFNPTMGIGKHRQMVEAQSSMEAYGKGAHPYYSAYGVINGWPETKYEIVNEQFTGKANNPTNPRGMKDILNKGLLGGAFTWSRGGGWQGPYITNEFWIDMNTWVVSHWAQNTNRSEESLFYEFATQHGFTGMQADRLRQIALLSIEGVRKGHCNSFTINQVWWARDEFFSVKANSAVINSILKNNLSEQVLAEKAEAAGIWKQIEAIAKQITIVDTALQEAIRVSCSYGRIKFELIEQMWTLMLENAVEEMGGQPRQQVLQQALQKYDQLWAEWRTLKQSSPYCATLYTDMDFLNKKEGSIGELVTLIRDKVK